MSHLSRLLVDRFPDFERRTIAAGTRGGAAKAHRAKPAALTREMEKFLHIAEKVTAGVLQAESAAEQMRDLRVRALSATTVSAHGKVSEELQGVLSKADRAAASAQKYLRELKERRIAEKRDRRKAEKGQQGGKSASEAKVDNSPQGLADEQLRATMFNALARRVHQTVERLHRTQALLAAEEKERGLRQMKLAFPQATEAEVEQMVRTNGANTMAVMEQKMLGADAVRALHHIQDRYRDVRRLEQSMADLHRMFVELAQLVEFQGEMLDQIETHIGKTKTHMVKAEKELKKARRAQAKAYQKMCCITIVLLVLMMIIMIPTFLAQAR